MMYGAYYLVFAGILHRPDACAASFRGLMTPLARRAFGEKYRDSINAVSLGTTQLIMLMFSDLIG